MTNPVVFEQRREERRPGSGTVRVCWGDPRLRSTEGRLVDVSDNGFRMKHNCSTLVSGQLVEFAHVEGKGQARVVWTRILNGAVETGFVVIK